MKRLLSVLMILVWMGACGDSTTGWVPPAGPGTEGQASGVVWTDSTEGVYQGCPYRLTKTLVEDAESPEGIYAIGQTIRFFIDIEWTGTSEEMRACGNLVVSWAPGIPVIDRVPEGLTLEKLSSSNEPVDYGCAWTLLDPAATDCGVNPDDPREFWWNAHAAASDDGAYLFPRLLLQFIVTGPCTTGGSRSLAATGPFGAWSDFNLVVMEDMNAKQSDVEGRVLVGGNVNLQSYGINAIHAVTAESGTTNAGTAMMYGRMLTALDTQFWGDVFSAVDASLPETLADTYDLNQSQIVDGTSKKVQAIDQATFNSDFGAGHLALTDLMDTLTEAHTNDAAKVVCTKGWPDPSDIHVIRCDASELSGVDLIHFGLDTVLLDGIGIPAGPGGPATDQTVYVDEILIRIPDANNLPTMQFTVSDEYDTAIDYRGGFRFEDASGTPIEPLVAASKTLWVITDFITTMTIRSIGWPGSILAPQADLVSNNTLFMGQVFVRRLNGWVWDAQGVQQFDEFGNPLLGPSDAQFNWVPFAGELIDDDTPDDGLCPNTACLEETCITVTYGVNESQELCQVAPCSSGDACVDPCTTMCEAGLCYFGSATCSEAGCCDCSCYCR